MKLKVPSKNYRAAYWFSLPFAYKRKRECEVSPPVEEVARSARGAGLAQHITACYKHDVMFCAKLTTQQSPHHSARWRAVKQFNGAKGVWVGETNEVCLRNVRVSAASSMLNTQAPFPKQSTGLFGRIIQPR